MHSAARFCVLLSASLILPACGTASSPTPSLPGSTVADQSQSPAVAVACERALRPFDPNDVYLTGAWAGNDGSIYYIRDLGTVVWLNGMSGREGNLSDLGRSFTNVGRGVMNGLEIDVEWAEVPRGEMLGQGTAKLRVEDDGTGNIQIVVSETDPSFSNQVWTPCEPG